MKALVAATCVALLAAVGYYFWGEYTEAQSRNADRIKYLKRAVEEECNEATRLLQGGPNLSAETRRLLKEKFDRCSAYAR